MPQKRVFFGYISVNILHKGDNDYNINDNDDDDDNNNNNKKKKKKKKMKKKKKNILLLLAPHYFGQVEKSFLSAVECMWG